MSSQCPLQTDASGSQAAEMVKIVGLDMTVLLSRSLGAGDRRFALSGKGTRGWPVETWQKPPHPPRAEARGHPLPRGEREKELSRLLHGLAVDDQAVLAG